MSQRRVLNFGSLNIDYVYEVDHFVRRGETLSGQNMHKYVGGKGLNQSVALARAGAPVFHAGCIGPEGVFLADYLRDSGVDISGVRCLDETPTGHAVIQRDIGGENCILLFGGANKCITKEQADGTLARFGEGDFLILQNEINEIPYLIKQAGEKGMVIVLNPSPLDVELLKQDLRAVDYLILNEVEAAGILSDTIDTEKNSTPEKIPEEVTGTGLLERLVKRFPETHIVLTLGKLGSLYAWKEERVFQPVYPAEAVDTTAAGDTYTGYFIAGILEGKTVRQAMEQAARAAAVAVTRPGAAPSIPFASELQEG